MPKKIYATRRIPDSGLSMLHQKGYELDINPKNRALSQRELLKALSKKPYDAVVCLLEDSIDKLVFDDAPSVKMYANYAVGFNNIDIEEAKRRGIAVSNTPGVLTEAVAEHTIALMLAIIRRIVESDTYLRKGKYKGWAPELLLGGELLGKTIGILGAGRIGSRVLHMATRGFDMKAIYYDVARSEEIEKTYDAKFYATPEEVLKEADIVSIHVPLLPTTHHLINKERLSLMKKGAYLINTSRGPVIDEKALVEALKKGFIRGAALDVFEHEPKLSKGLAKLANVVITPHTASATEPARNGMARLVAENIIAFFEGKPLPSKVA